MDTCIYCTSKNSRSPGELLRCGKCQRLAHSTCLRSGIPPGQLEGDNFFEFTCQPCAKIDTDIVFRANLSITQLLLLTLYNLHMKNPAGHRKGFFHWELDIYKFIVQHWNDLFRDNGLGRKEHIRGIILAHLSQYPHFFAGGHDLVNDGGWYKLCQVLPPAVLLHQEAQKKKDRNTNQGGPTNKKARFEEGNIMDRFPVKGVYVKKEVAEVPMDKSSCGLQYLERNILKPHASLPNSIYEDDCEQEEVKVKEEIKVEEDHLEDFTEDVHVGQADMIVSDLLPPPLEESLFTQKKTLISNAQEDQEEEDSIRKKDRQRRDNVYHRDNMPKTKQTRGRAKQRRPEANRPEVETAERDHSPQSSISSVDVIPETQQDPLESQRQPSSEDEATRQQKKWVRVSKKEIPEYRWTEEAELRLAELVKENPQVYDKKQKEWLNVAAKNSQWDRVGEQLEPPATGPQCKKHYENMRTRVGKIMKKEKKSGAGQPQRSARDNQIMETWSFLMQHIVWGETVPSEQFAVPESAAVTISDDDDEVRSTGSQSQASTTTGKGKGKGKRSRPPTTETATTTADTGVTQSDLSDAVKQILSKADSLGASHSYTGQQKIIHNFACLLEGPMQGIPEDSWHEFQIDCLNLVHCNRQQRQLFQQPQQQPSVTWPAPQQQQPWQQPPASQPSPLTWMPLQSPQSSGQSSWTRNT
ncbi:uncharacterized protein LOC143020994 isoform X4 [Oratosquilla oratoria]|uniref:uncharacterized protein LOC143020994 isoform X4 n=1 Tax=Oratosquilla oratoria TaxID=337810 RepID=UPI003F7623CD